MSPPPNLLLIFPTIFFLSPSLLVFLSSRVRKMPLTEKKRGEKDDPPPLFFPLFASVFPSGAQYSLAKKVVVVARQRVTQTKTTVVHLQEQPRHEDLEAPSGSLSGENLRPLPWPIRSWCCREDKPSSVHGSGGTDLNLCT